jgi:hypothetical protein
MLRATVAIRPAATRSRSAYISATDRNIEARREIAALLGVKLERAHHRPFGGSWGRCGRGSGSVVRHGRLGGSGGGSTSRSWPRPPRRRSPPPAAATRPAPHRTPAAPETDRPLAAPRSASPCLAASAARLRPGAASSPLSPPVPSAIAAGTPRTAADAPMRPSGSACVRHLHRGRCLPVPRGRAPSLRSRRQSPPWRWIPPSYAGLSGGTTRRIHRRYAGVKAASIDDVNFIVLSITGS